MANYPLPTEEIESLSFYDFQSYLGTPSFHRGGPKSSEKLAELCQIDKNKTILIVGCGTGFSACHIARQFGCSVVGVDIAEISIEKANERAKREYQDDKVEFRIGDAYNLPFEAETFDVVMTEFVSQFLDQDKAFKDFRRVLKSGGYIGINEMYKDEDIPSEIYEEIASVERIYNELTNLPLVFNTSEDWKQKLKNAGLLDIQIYENKKYMSIIDEILFYKKYMGGFREILKYYVRMAKYKQNNKIGYEFKERDKAKNILFKKKSTSKYLGYVLGIGKKR